MKIPINYILSALITSSIAVQAVAQQQNQNPDNSQCMADVQAQRAARTSAVSNGSPIPQLSLCEQYNIVALANKSTLDSSAIKRTADNKYVCVQYGGYSLDFDDCMRVKSAYDQVIIAEAMMLKAQEIQVNENNIRQMKEFEIENAKGNGQNAAIDATIKRNQQNAQMYKKQAGVYISAVGYLSTMLSAWKGKRDRNIANLCSQQGKNLEGAVLAAHAYKLSEVECLSMIKGISSSNKIFPNQDERGRFLMALAEFFNKAAEAKRKAGINEAVAEKLKESDFINDEQGHFFDKCFQNPLSIDCKNQNYGPRDTSSGSFRGSQFGMGESGANQSFDFGSGGADLGQNGPEGNGSGDEKVADIASPFESAAKEASGILDPAAAATITPGAQPSAPGDGGGGGGGGGGSASLDDELAGATPEKSGDPEIETNKLSGKYGKNGGGGFQAVKSDGKDSANPFSSLFDSKGEEGGVEADRSIAADDNSGVSGLFEKISRRYSQVQQDKRVESPILE